MIERKEFTCAECPRGCRLTVETGDGLPRVSGNSCPKGEAFGAQEAVEPMRVLSTTVAVSGTKGRRLPVRTDGMVPLSRLLEAMDALEAVVVSPPLRNGDVVVAGLLGLGVDLVAAADLR